MRSPVDCIFISVKYEGPFVEEVYMYRTAESGAGDLCVPSLSCALNWGTLHTRKFQGKYKITSWWWSW